MRLAATPLLAALLVAPLALTGCSKDSNNLMGLDTAPASGLTESRDAEPSHGYPAWKLPRVMFVHASPDAPAVDVRVGWFRAVRDLSFGENSRYKRLLPGERRVRVNVAGTATTVIDAQVKLQPSTNYSVFAVNSVKNLEPIVLTDDLSRPAKGNAHVRFIHLSPDAPAVDVAVQGGPVVFGNKSFKEYTEFTPLPAGTYDLEVRVAGTSTVALPLPGVTLEAGKIYTVYAKGFLAGSGAQALGAGVIVNANYSWSADRDALEPAAAVE
jgi:hypothetical protein